jgi:hypothetical protein
MIRRRKSLFAAALMLSSALSGCGTYVPEMQEFWGNHADASVNVNNLTGQVACELGQAIRYVIDFDKKQPTQYLKVLEKWGVQVTLNLIVEEKTTLNPGVSLNTPMHNAPVNFAGETLPAGGSPLLASVAAASTYSFLSTAQSYSFGIGGQFSSDATRNDKYQFFYKVTDFLKGGKHWQEGRTESTCIPSDPANATLFPHGDLKIREWMEAMVGPQISGTGDLTPTSANGITHDVKFVIVTDGNVSPTWKLVRVSANTNSPLFDAMRTRTQEAIITLGPLDQSKGPGAPSSLSVNAENSHFAQEIGSAVAQALRGQATY